MRHPHARLRLAFKTILASWLSLTALFGCGSAGGGGDDDGFGAAAGWKIGVFAPSVNFANRCASPSGLDTETGEVHRAGSSLDENNFLRSWTHELYLWYREVPDLDPATYSDTLAYFNVLKTNALTASGNPKDRFHFTYPTPAWRALSQSGVTAGYGAQWVIIGTSPSRRVIVAYNEPSSPAQANNVGRGVEVFSVDDVSVATANTQAAIDVLNEGLFPTTPGRSHRFVLRDPGSSATRSVTMVATTVTADPVHVTSLNTPTGTIGYILFNDHIATASAQLRDAVAQLQTADIDDLVLDLRYNSGGLLSIASELAYMIAGSARTAGRTFEQMQFNDQHPTRNPVTNQPLAPAPFLSTASDGQPLPTLNLPRVFVLTGGDTCSASESIINSLRGIDVEVIQIGSRTCGKPYGFYPEDNCGTTYFSIQFRGVNAKDFGDYTDGFVPTPSPDGSDAAQVVGCPVADDFEHALGDPAEARLAAALLYQSTLTCPALGAMANGGAAKPSFDALEGRAYKLPYLTNRIVQR